jgi:glycine betaine/choline ABC-type transport system substrate-binding protein
MRMTRMAALGATTLVLLVSACSSGGSSSPSASTAAAASVPASAPASAPASEPASAPASAGPSVASLLVLGGPPECPTRPFCEQGLEKTYGLTFKEFKPLDVAGPLTVEALKNNDIQVGMLLTSDPAYAANGFVLLQDDKHLQLADNLVPILQKSIVDANPDVATLLNPVTAKITQGELTALNQAVTTDGQSSADAAKKWLTDNGFLPGAGGSGKGDVTVGSTNFYEQEVLAEIYAQVLEANGYNVDRKFQLGAREVVFPALEKGDIDLLVEYAATALEYVNKGAGEATSDAAATTAKLNERLAPLGLVALDPASATDQNGFAVTADTASQYALTNLSDLAKPAP